MDDSSANGLGPAFAALMVVYFIFILAIVALSIWIQWRILVKAGYSGWLSLLMLTGIGGLIVQLIMAFGRWPIEDELAAALGGRPAPAPSNPLAGPPATL